MLLREGEEEASTSPGSARQKAAPEFGICPVLHAAAEKTECRTQTNPTKHQRPDEL